MCDPNEARHPLPPPQPPPQFLNTGTSGCSVGSGGIGISNLLPPAQGGIFPGNYNDYQGANNSNNSTNYHADFSDGYRSVFNSPNCLPGPQVSAPQTNVPPNTGNIVGVTPVGNNQSGVAVTSGVSDGTGVASNTAVQGGGSSESNLGYESSNYDQNYNDDYSSYEDRDGYRKDPAYRDRDHDRSDRTDRRIHDRRRGRPMDRPRRDRDRDRDRDRERSFDRDRDRSRSRDGRDRKDRNPRDSRSDRYEAGFDCDSSSRDSGDSFRDRDSGRENRDDRAGERWMTDTPTHTILLRGLRYPIEEKDILAELMSIGLSIKDVRLMRKSSGASRGFAFVEFQNVADAQRWMEQNQGSLYLLDMFPVTMHYSQPKIGPDKAQKGDWVCNKCGAHNFKRRDICFKCSISREESERAKEPDGFDQVGTNPCNTLIFRGLDALTTEETLSQALSQQTSLTAKNIKIIRDELTNTSRGYGFAEMTSILESTQVLEHLQQLNPPFEVDGKLILVAFAKNTFSTVMSTLSNRPNSYTGNQMQQKSWSYDHQQQQQQQQPQGDYYYNQSGYEHSSYYDQNNAYYGQAQNYDSNYYNNQNFSQQGDSTNAAAAVALAAIQQAQAAKQYQKHYQKQSPHQSSTSLVATANVSSTSAVTVAPPTVTSETSTTDSSKTTSTMSAIASTVEATATSSVTTTAASISTSTTLSESSTEKDSASINKQQTTTQQMFQTPTGMPVNNEYPKYPSPDVCTYQYDESSGYYYDPSTGLYYDANSQYYYNATTCQFLYWDAEKSTYLPAPTSAQGMSAGGGPGSGVAGGTGGSLGTEELKDNNSDLKGKKKEDKKEKVKIAKKIAKDMEKWAKTLNGQKEAIKEGYKKVVFSPTGVMTPIRRWGEERESATADAGYAILEKTCSGSGLEEKRLMPPPSPMASVDKAASLANSTTVMPAAAAAAGTAFNPALVASYGGDSDSDDEQFEQSPQAGGSQRTSTLDESKLTDWGKLACLLCKRQFPSKEALTRHTQLSDLHKQNLEVLKKKYGSGGPDGDKKGPYRDRAKERREKYGAPSPPEPRRKFEAPVNYEEPTKQGIGNDNIGNKLLQKMGWSHGQGLGKKGQGIVAPIQAQRRLINAGLGVRGSNVVSDAGDSYKTAVKKTMFARYHELE